MEATNALEALKFCVRCLNDILDLPLSTNKNVFTEETIADVRKLAEAAIYFRKKRNYGVIGGSVAGLVGGAMSIAGAILIPFTFGTSIVLIASGAAVGLAGAGVNIGFSVEKVIGDKNRVEEFKPVLEMFVDFNKHFAKATVTIHLLKTFVESKIKQGINSRQLGSDELTQITNLKNELKQLYQSGENHMDIRQQFCLLDVCVQNIRTEMGDMLKHMLKVNDIADLAALAEKAEKASFDSLEEAIPEKGLSDTVITFRVFVRRYLAADTELPSVDMAAPLGEAGQAAAKTVVGGGSAAARSALRTIDAANDLSKVGGAVARVASGVSAASIVLSAVGIGIDLAFLGHAIYDLVQINKDEDRRNENSSEPKGAESNKTKSKEFSEQLLDLAEIMEFVNQIYRA
ncbi:uncharacterized protein [Apostichopus japonicus]|uniref:uncharacterized protein n=1 Tax=Stichopus japonicus TaxID=307972 RepID=UPI003AB2FDA9